MFEFVLFEQLIEFFSFDLRLSLCECWDLVQREVRVQVRDLPLQLLQGDLRPAVLIVQDLECFLDVLQAYLHAFYSLLLRWEVQV